MKKPSAGALRAAQQIAYHRIELSIEGTAEIIDRESGLGGLLEAARLAAAYLTNAPGIKEILEGAITKVES